MNTASVNRKTTDVTSASIRPDSAAGKFLLAATALLLGASTPTSPLKEISPVIGDTPIISSVAESQFQTEKKQFKELSEIMASYSNYETAKQQLNEQQLALLEKGEARYTKTDLWDISPYGCSWYCGGGPSKITASSELSPIQDQKLSYAAPQAHDWSLKTAWVEGVAGYGIGEYLNYKFDKNSPPVTAVSIYNGYLKSEQIWRNNARVKQLKMYVNNVPYAILNLQDIMSRQTFQLAPKPGLQGKDADMYIKFEILSVYEGDKFEDTAISEMEFDGTGVHCFAKGTPVTTPHGTKPIEQICIGDTVLTLNSATNAIEAATVQATASRKHYLYELDFDGIKVRATDTHPFFYNGTFYSVVANNDYGVQTKALTVGQKILCLKDGVVDATVLKAVVKSETSEDAFTITALDRNNLFFVNGICVMAE